MRVFLAAGTIALLMAAGGPSTVWGQRSGGSSALGSLLSPQSGTAFGSSGSSFGSSGSSSGSGSSSFGSGGTTGSSGFGQLGSQSNLRGSSQPGGFIGSSSQTANQGFVGSRNSGTGGSTQSQSGSGRSGSSRYGSGQYGSGRGGSGQYGSGQYGSGQYGSGQYGSGQGRNSYQSSRGGRTSRTEVRTVIRLGFQIARPAAMQIAPRLQTRLERIMVPGAQSPVQVRVEKGTATLQGVVATAHARVIAERLALLEAGIWKVNNELVVADSNAPTGPR